MFDRREGEAHCAEREQPQGEGLAVRADDREDHDGDGAKEGAEGEAEQCRGADLLRVRRGVHEEAKFTEERRLEAEVQDGAADHLGEEEGADDRPDASFDVHVVLRPWRCADLNTQRRVRRFRPRQQIRDRLARKADGYVDDDVSLRSKALRRTISATSSR